VDALKCSEGFYRVCALSVQRSAKTKPKQAAAAVKAHARRENQPLRVHPTFPAALTKESIRVERMSGLLKPPMRWLGFLWQVLAFSRWPALLLCLPRPDRLARTTPWPNKQ